MTLELRHTVRSKPPQYCLRSTRSVTQESRFPACHSAVGRTITAVTKPTCLGRVKFFKPEKGWGRIVSDDVPGDVWVHFSAIDMSGYKSLEEGQVVDFRYEEAPQDSWSYRATWVRPLGGMA